MSDLREEVLLSTSRMQQQLLEAVDKLLTSISDVSDDTLITDENRKTFLNYLQQYRILNYAF